MTPPPPGNTPDPNGSWPPPPQAGMPPQGYAPPDNTLGGLIPTKNSSALIAYYLGVFSIIPCLGIPMGLTALFLGIRGLQYVKQYPAVKGRTHAWVGIIAGGFFGIGYLVLTVIYLVALNRQ